MFGPGATKGFILFLLAIIFYAPYFRSLHFCEKSCAFLYGYFSNVDGVAIGCLTVLLLQNIKFQIE